MRGVSWNTARKATDDDDFGERAKLAVPVPPWFAAASMLTTILHELVHACAAFGLGVRSTLYNYSADLDLTPAQAATNLPVRIGIAGPVFYLALGIVSLWRSSGHTVQESSCRC
jgi:hypothetical protein